MNLNQLSRSVNSVSVANLITVICTILSCDETHDYPVSVADVRASRIEKRLEHDNDLTAPVKELRDPEVVLGSGKVVGYYMTIVREQNISAFEGIPYAQSPSGERRFKDPVPLPADWNANKIFEARSPGPICIQLHYGRLKGNTENCLTVNVYTKNVNPVKPYPVIIFIHGGFWISSSGSHFGPAYLLDNDVIFVSFNYRLGVLGFFTTGDEECPGNFGLKDQAFLIKWVYENIDRFGGDPKRITLTGYSAGAVSTHLQMMSNSESKNKIASAISMSGTAYNIWGLNRYNTSVAVSNVIANVSGCPTNLGSKLMMECMRGLDASTLVANQLFTIQHGAFIPSIEADYPGAFLTLEPDEAYSRGKVARIPWIASQTSKEVNVPATPLQANVLASLIRGAILTDLSGLLTVRWHKIDEDRIRSKIFNYYGAGSINDLGQKEISTIATDRYFSVSIHKALQMHSQIAPTYGSIFKYNSKLGRAGKLGFNNYAEFGVMHGDDLTYLLNSTHHHPPIKRFDAHFAITKLLVNLYGNFAKYGEPIYYDEGKTQYRIWETITDPERLRYLSIDEETKMIDDPFKQVSKFWEDLGIPDTKPYFKL